MPTGVLTEGAALFRLLGFCVIVGTDSSSSRETGGAAARDADGDRDLGCGYEKSMVRFVVHW